ncbi:hypothetical protein C9439_03560 [archaeon SCG-AAA382B04]|nr:hypothetical protein C9439_03560 [archaeon SCG-AAA382B04]
MISRIICPICNKQIALQIKQTTQYQLDFRKDGAATKYQQQIENYEIPKKWKTTTLYKKLFKKYRPKLKKGIKKQKLKKQLKRKHKLDHDLTQAFISTIKNKGVIEKNQTLKLPD